MSGVQLEQIGGWGSWGRPEDASNTAEAVAVCRFLALCRHLSSLPCPLKQQVGIAVLLWALNALWDKALRPYRSIGV